MARKFSQIAAATTIAGADTVVGVQSGPSDVQYTMANIASFVATSHGSALTKVDDTNVTLTLGGSPATALLSGVSIAAGWTGTLALSRLAQGTDGQIIVGQTGSSPLYKTLSGEATLSSLGSLSISRTFSPTMIGTWTFAPAANTSTPAISIQQTGIFTNTQENDLTTSLLNGYNPSTEIHSWWGNYATNALLGGNVVPAASPVFLATGVFGGIKSLRAGPGGGGGDVAGLFLAEAYASNGNVFGINPVVVTNTGLTGLTLANEFDFNINSDGALITGISLQLGGNATTASNAIGYALFANSTLKWNGGFYIADGAVTDYAYHSQGFEVGATGIITAPSIKLSGTSNQLVFQSAGVTGTISWAPATSNKMITLPNGSTDFTATGGTSQVLKQVSTGAAITVAQLAASDLSNGTTGSGAVALAASPFFTTGVSVYGTGTYGRINIGRNDRLTPLDFNAVINLNGKNSSDTLVTYQQITALISSETAGAETGYYGFATLQAGTLQNRMLVGNGVAVGDITPIGIGKLITESSAVIGTGAINTNATDGFLYIPTCAGTPTGTPTAYTGRAALVYDTTNNKLYVYNAAWKRAQVTAVDAIYA